VAKPHLKTAVSSAKILLMDASRFCGKTAKHLEIQHRHIYTSEIETCPHGGRSLQPQAFYQWRKTVQQMTGTVYALHRASHCLNPDCRYVRQIYPSAQAQIVTLPGCDRPNWLVAGTSALGTATNLCRLEL